MEIISQQDSGLRVLSGTAHPKLTEAICNILGILPMKASIGHFEDGEIRVKIEENVRGKDVFVVQSFPTPNDNIMELILTIDALKRASAKRVTAILSYPVYARSDRKAEGRTHIGMRVLADMLEAVKVDRVVCVDIHSQQSQGFFSKPVDCLDTYPIFVKYFKSLNLDSMCFLSTDIGHGKKTERYAKKFNADLAFIDKRRISDSEVSASAIIGNFKASNIFLVDDMIASFGSMNQAINIATSQGEKKSIYVAATHFIGCGRAFERIAEASNTITELIVTDSLPPRKPPKVTMVTLSIAPLLAETIKRIHNDQSVSELFID